MAGVTMGTVSRAICRRLTSNHTKFYRQVAQGNHRLLSSTAKKSPGNGKLFWFGVAGAFGVVTAYEVYRSVKGKAAHIAYDEIPLLILDHLPDISISRKIVNANDKTGLDLILFQYQTCPFCCKVRAFLDSKGLSYSVVEVDSVLRQQLKWSQYKKVPILLARAKDGKYVQLTDSSVIISILASLLQDPKADIYELAKFYPTLMYVDDEGKKKQEILNKYFLMHQENGSKALAKEIAEEERKWRQWTDEHFVHVITPNVYRTHAEALQTFKWFSEAGEWEENFPNWERHLVVYTGATAMYLISKRLKKRHNLSDDLRGQMYAECRKWVQSIKNGPFHGGKTPDLADLAVFGILNAIEGCQAFTDLVENTQIGPWFDAMKDYSLKHKGTVIKNIA